MEGKPSSSRDCAWDAIVVGAGPAGSVCAQHLAQRGHRVLLLERDDVPGARANCTGIIGDEAFEAFDLPRDLVVNTISDVVFRGPYGRGVEFDAGRHLAHVVRRFEFDAALARRAQATGAELRTGVRVTGGTQYPGGIDVHGLADDRTVSFHGRAVVLAVGYRLDLLRSFGMNGPREFVQGAQLLCRAHELEGVEVFIGRRWAPGSFGWAVPLGDGWAKVGVTTVRNAKRHLDSILASEHLAGRIDLAGARLRLSPIPVGTFGLTHDDRVVVVGEAAGQVKTTSHGGIYYGMLGARTAASTIDVALQRDDLSAASLSVYEAAWRELLEPELDAGEQLREAFDTLSDAKIAALMWIGGMDSLMDLIREKADFDWHRPLLEQLAAHRLVGQFFKARSETAGA